MPRTLSADVVEQVVAPDAQRVQACYVKHGLDQRRSTGSLKIELIIRPDGGIHRMWVLAPGVEGKGLSSCVSTLSNGWRFPVRRFHTHAVVPFFFLKTKGPGTRPLESCWNPKGCPEQVRRHRAARRRRAAPERTRGEKTDGKARKDTRSASSKGSKGASK